MLLPEVKSTLVDLRVVEAPYVRMMGQRMLSFSGGTIIQQWELRFTQPNRAHLSAKAMHSLEHLLAKHVQKHLPTTIELSAMACATGFRLLVNEELDFARCSQHLAEALEEILEAKEVPAAQEWRCGQVSLHSLEEAQDAAANFLAARATWDQVVPLSNPR